MNSIYNPHSPEGFEKLFAEPARQVAHSRAVLFTTGELGFYIADRRHTDSEDDYSLQPIRSCTGPDDLRSYPGGCGLLPSSNHPIKKAV